jgi:hypothetical protein
MNPDVDGQVIRHRPGTPFAGGFAFGEGGLWVEDDRLKRVWESGSGEGSASPIGEDVARWLMSAWVRQGRSFGCRKTSPRWNCRGLD